MITQKITLENSQRFERKVPITAELIDGAIEVAVNKLLHDLPRLGECFTPPETKNFIYEPRENNDWTSGMNTGVYWLAYELSGNKRFLEAAKKQVSTYRERLETKAEYLDHDVGFVFSPSCVADYVITGDEDAKAVALEAAELLANSFSKEGGFIRRSNRIYPGSYRTLVDTMMNLPLLLWAWKETGKEEYKEVVMTHYRTTEKYLVREDGSTFHHFEFDRETHEPIGGMTLQGFSDNSCWSRGHSWLIYGYPLAYGYLKDEDILPVHQGVTYYFLNKLPGDCIPYWDLVFTEGSIQPRDSSAAAVSVCGLLEMCRHLSDDNPDKVIFKNAADSMMRALIQQCSNIDYSRDGLLTKVTHALPQGRGIEESAIYGDFFYLEALLRYKNPDWKKYW